ncbi:Amuc_1098 family type IV pilus outer membrane protein [Sulfuriroseicoccus oceanibius]|uniref:Type II and III secretion system protein n=1 Tax=Sulfuriroseicoccus oceanibius TaxID=2707525 RepID=A0A6B3LAP6_9BACT|nr:Amuc_1098 family type IV pilus outer membrane protein [Sulfuriroseicoccus oceanibius]QQL44514.1 type II and III secretion system protein [Sulfuriroseicoccus oceanibius]
MRNTNNLKTSYWKLAAVAATAAALTPLSMPSALAGSTGYTGGAGYGSAGYSSGLSSTAQRELIRRQEMTLKAREIAVEGDEKLAADDFEGALQDFREARDLIPRGNVTADLHESVTSRYVRASLLLAKQRAGEGRYTEARQLIDDVLLPTVDPGNKRALRMRELLEDEERFPLVSTGGDDYNELQQRAAEVTRLLKLGESYFLLDDYDNAEKMFDQVLRIDKYNKAAQRFHEKIERFKIEYYSVARTRTRAEMLAEVDSEWEIKPALIDVPKLGGSEDDGGQTDGRLAIQRKLDRLIIPSVQFEDQTLREVVQFLRNKSREIDTDPNPANRGVSIVIDSRSSLAEGGRPDDLLISEINLRNLPLGEVLRYVADLTDMRVKVEEYAVVLAPNDSVDKNVYTRSFDVPPTFIPTDGGGGAADFNDDPFATGGGGGGAAVAARMTAQEYLESRGVPFGENGRASYDPGNSVLTVTGTPQAMELVEVIVDEAKNKAPKMVNVRVKFVEVTQRNGYELGFDWLLGPLTVDSQKGVVVTGGTAGNGTAVNPGDWPVVDPTSGIIPQPLGSNPVTAGNRSGDFGITRGAIDSILNSSISEAQGENVAPGVLGIAGILTEPQFQVVMRALNQKKGVDLLSAPQVTTRPGTPARVEVIREFIYPTEYDPPELPNAVGANNIDGGGGDGGGGDGVATVTSFPVTPATPTAFETRNTGVTLEVDPTVGANNFTIDLNLAPEVVEFDGFINYGNPITTPAIDALGRPTSVTITDNRIDMPVFSTRRVKTQVTVWDGQTVALGGLIREDVQDIEDSVPILGDIPIVGRLFKTKAEERFKRNLMVFVTARLIDPAGKNLNEYSTDVSGETSVSGGPSSDLF